ncbi:MAG: hypothetical protein ACREC9_12645 [Methylocella sp.]
MNRRQGLRAARGGTVLAGMARDGHGAPKVALDDEQRAMALLATAYERPVAPHVLAKLRRACDLWNEGEKALAHIHLAYTNLPPCDEERALRLFVAEELIEAGVTPHALMKAQGLDSPLDLSKAHFNPDQPRAPAGSGRESGEWTDGEGNFTPVTFRSRRGRHGRGGIDSIRSFLERLREFLKPKEGVAHQIKPFRSPESDLPRPGYGEEVSIPGLPDTIEGTDITEPRARMPNYEVDLSRSEFESELLELGWTEEPSPDGKVLIFPKDGARYTVREFSDSTDGPTAEFFHPFSSRSDADMKLRLRKD